MTAEWKEVAPDVERLEVLGGWLYRVRETRYSQDHGAGRYDECTVGVAFVPDVDELLAGIYKVIRKAQSAG